MEDWEIQVLLQLSFDEEKFSIQPKTRSQIEFSVVLNLSTMWAMEVNIWVTTESMGGDHKSQRFTKHLVY